VAWCYIRESEMEREAWVRGRMVMLTRRWGYQVVRMKPHGIKDGRMFTNPAIPWDVLYLSHFKGWKKKKQKTR